MTRLSYRLTPTRLTVGGILMATGTGIVSLIPALVIPGAMLFTVGALTAASGFFAVSGPQAVLLDVWDAHRIREALKQAGPESTIRILQTWFPDREEFIPFLQDLLISGGKSFRLRIMLMDPEAASGDHPDVLLARVRHRPESRQIAAQHIKDTVSQLASMKEAVDSGWARSRHGAQLDLQMRMYDFLPFGPIYEIVDDVAFVGIYLNTKSSSAAPMIVVDKPESHVYKVFDQQLDVAWDGGTAIYPDPR